MGKTVSLLITNFVGWAGVSLTVVGLVLLLSSPAYAQDPYAPGLICSACGNGCKDDTQPCDVECIISADGCPSKCHCQNAGVTSCKCDI